MQGHCHLIIAMLLGVAGLSQANYYGKEIGSFTQRGATVAEHHNVAGTVYAVDDNTLQIIGFTYDGAAPDAFFWIGMGATPDGNGVIIPKALGKGDEKLLTYSNQDLVIHLAGSASIQSYNWISVWCRTVGANFADVTIPANFVPPSEYSLGPLGFNPAVHQVTASDVIILNSRQIQFRDLTYDGRGPDAYFWVDSKTPPTSTGTRVPQVGETSASKLTQRLDRVTKTVQLPSDATLFNIMNIGLWCVLARQNFGHVNIPQDLMSRQVIIPYSVAADTEPDVMTTTQNAPQQTDSVYRNSTDLLPSTSPLSNASITQATTPEPTYDNCEVLSNDEFQVSWTISGSEISIRLSSRQQSGNYMGFGLSGSDTGTSMDGSDVVIAWIDQQTAQARAVDYYLGSRQQCVRSSGQGVCPDTVRSSSSTDDVTLTGYYVLDGITHITYRRPLAATDTLLDKAVSTSGSQYVSWGLGPINADGLATYHNAGRTQGNKQINFGRANSSCVPFTVSTGSGEDRKFNVPAIEALTATTFRCDIGQAGGAKGYQGITGTIGWGIAWYINGNLIPEITVKRNVTYTFEVYGGNNLSQSASYHPFYITNSGAGGYTQLTASERVGHTIYAGPVNGSYCFYDETAATPADLDNIETYQAYRDTLRLSCPGGNPGEPGRLVWTPDADTPNTVYYQCYTHRYLGWKIHVTDGANVCVLSMVVMVMFLLVAIFMK